MERIVMILGKGGSTGESVVREIEKRQLPAKVTRAIINQPNVPSIDRMKSLGIPTNVIYEANFFGDKDSLGLVLKKTLRHDYPTLILLLGTLMIIPDPVIEEFSKTADIFNQHGGSLPETKNLSGPRIAATMLNFNEETGRNEGMDLIVQRVVPGAVDGGPTVGRKHVPILPGDTPMILQERNKPLEHQLVLETVINHINGTITEEENVYRYMRPSEEDKLARARKKAIRENPRE